MYLLTLSDASLYIRFLLDLENVPRGRILKDTFCLPGGGGWWSKPWPNTLIRNIAIRLNFLGIRGNPTTSLTTDIYTQIREWIFEFCLEKSCMFTKINLMYFIVSNHDSESAQLPSTKRIIHIGRGLRRCTYFVFFVKKVEQSGFVLQ